MVSFLKMTEAGGEGWNRRKSPRYALTARGTGWCLTRVPAGPFDVTTSNISMTGMMIHASSDPAELLREGDDLLLGFPDPGSRSQMTLKARVVWRRQGLMNLLGSWAFGVEFRETAEEQIRKLYDPAVRKGEPLK